MCYCAGSSTACCNLKLLVRINTVSVQYKNITELPPKNVQSGGGSVLNSHGEHLTSDYSKRSDLKYWVFSETSLNIFLKPNC